MAAAAIAAKAAINRKIAKQKKAEYDAAIAAGLDPEEEFMKRVLARMEEEKELAAKLIQGKGVRRFVFIYPHGWCGYRRDEL